MYDQPGPSLAPTHNPSHLRNEYAHDDEPAFPAEYHTGHNPGLYAPDHNQSYYDDPYAGARHEQHQQQGGYYEDEGAYGGRREEGYSQGHARGQVDGYGAPVGGYEEKGYAKEEGYEYAHHHQEQERPPGPQGGRWDQGGYR